MRPHARAGRERPRRSFYVSSEAVYLWVNGDEPSAARVYRMPLGSGEVTAARVHGAPIDQLSFDEAADGTLRVVAARRSGGDAMWRPEGNGGDLSLVTIPADAFASAPVELDPSAYVALHTPSSAYGVQNRFVGAHLLLGSGTAWAHVPSPVRDTRCSSSPSPRPGPLSAVPCAHPRDRGFCRAAALPRLGAGVLMSGALSLA